MKKMNRSRCSGKLEGKRLLKRFCNRIILFVLQRWNMRLNPKHFILMGLSALVQVTAAASSPLGGQNAGEYRWASRFSMLSWLRCMVIRDVTQYPACAAKHAEKSFCTRDGKLNVITY